MRYIIGIDLGTTNSCVAYVDTLDPKASIRVFPIPQLIEAGQIESKPLLPSFCYLAEGEEWQKGSLSLPWSKENNYFVGSFALSHGARIPTRLVTSAKSWLCHASIGRKDPILPPSGEPSFRISPVEASYRFIKHIADAWNWYIAKGKPEDEFEQQEIILTVPASFDEVARSLTAESAKKANLTSMTMLEEPQAAFYNWIEQHSEIWKNYFSQGDRILVCDVGGGTTDFSLIEIVESTEGLSFQRMAVGDHLLLGGENIDHALAYALADKIKVELSTSQWLQLCHQARVAKEAIFGQSKESHKIVLMGTGSSIVGGAISTTLSAEEANEIVLRGFFAQISWENAKQKKTFSGMRTAGLPYEEEPSIIKHLAHFLSRHGISSEKPPTHVLFNGGTMLPPAFQEEVLNSLKNWFPQGNIKKLTASHFDYAVARGAAYFGKVRRGMGISIKSGSPRAYYLGIEIKKSDTTCFKAITLLPRGSEEGSSYTAEETFNALPNQPVFFQLYTSHVRLHDSPGDLIEIDEQELHPLPKLKTVFRFGKGNLNQTISIPVKLSLTLTHIGTLELWLQSVKTEHRWSLEFQLKSSSGQDDILKSIGAERKEETYTTDLISEAGKLIIELYSQKTEQPKKIIEKLEDSIGLHKQDWPIGVLRGLFSYLLQCAQNRKITLEHHERWWNLAGFFMRPGSGYPMDDFRIKELWKIILGELTKTTQPEILLQQLICYRRIAGGLSRGQQLQIANELISPVLDNKGKNSNLYSERIRTLASLELIDNSTKIKIGKALTDKICQGVAGKAEYWALGRIGSRHLFQGTLAHIIPASYCSEWIEKILSHKEKLEDTYIITLMTQMARLTNHKEINISETLRLRIHDIFPSEDLYHTLFNPLEILASEQAELLGESLPPGLHLSVSV